MNQFYVMLPALPTNIRLGRMLMAAANTLAYYKWQKILPEKFYSTGPWCHGDQHIDTKYNGTAKCRYGEWHYADRRGAKIVSKDFEQNR